MPTVNEAQWNRWAGLKHNTKPWFHQRFNKSWLCIMGNQSHLPDQGLFVFALLPNTYPRAGGGGDTEKRKLKESWGFFSLLNAEHDEEET